MSRHRRVTARLQRLMRVDVKQGDGWRLAASVDLSLGGVCLKLYDDAQASTPPPTPGERLALRLHLPGREPIETLAEVRWCDNTAREVGFQFEGMAPDDMLAWARWLQGGPQ